jgi:hypothetical protein
VTEKGKVKRVYLQPFTFTFYLRVSRWISGRRRGQCRELPRRLQRTASRNFLVAE